MHVLVYGDFNCPYSYLASQRTDQLTRAGLTVHWRAVEHCPSLPFTGSRSDGDPGALERELADVASLALPGEQIPARPPTLISKTSAAVAAYAEAISDGVADDLRRGLFHAIWAQGLQLSSAVEVRRVITTVMWPPEDITARLASPEFPSLLLRDPDLTQIVRRSGGTIVFDGGPLTSAGWRRIRQWRHEWLTLPSQTIPAVIGHDEVLRPGIDGLRYLADLVRGVTVRPTLPLSPPSPAPAPAGSLDRDAGPAVMASPA